MKSKQIVDAYNSISPGQDQKQRMLEAILHEAEFAENPQAKKKREPAVYTASPTKTSRGSVFAAIAASFMLLALSGGILAGLMNQSEAISQPPPAETAASQPQPTASQEAADPALSGIGEYDTVLRLYAASVEEQWDWSRYEQQGLSTMIAEDGAWLDLGWCLLDIDGNGTEELLIGKEERIYDLYTVQANGLKQTAVARTGTRYALCQNSILSATTVQGEDLPWFKTYFKYENGSLTEVEAISYEEADSPSGAYWQYYQGTTQELRQPISENEAGAIVSDYIELELFMTRFQPVPADVYDTDATYGETLQLFRKALTERWSPGECGANDLSMQLVDYYDRPGEIGYAFRNLDGGEEELLITNGGTVLNLFTVTDGAVEWVFIGADRHTYWLLEDDTILRRRLTATDGEFYILYKLVHPNLSEESGLVIQEAYGRELADDPDAPWHFSPDGQTLGERCGSFDAESRIGEWMAAIQQINFRRFN